MHKKVLIIGSGDLGMGVANSLIEEGHEVSVLKRTPPIKKEKLLYIKADMTDHKTLQDMVVDFDHVLLVVAPDSRSEEAYVSLFDTGVTNILQLFADKNPKASFLFVSSTAVYAQAKGELVDEKSLTNPINYRGKILLKAENRILAHNQKNCVVRFSGIYGQGRNHIVEKLKKGEPIQSTPPYYTNRIHREDCIRVLLFLLKKQFDDVLSHNLYLATDHDSLSMYDLALHLAKHYDLKAPQKAILKEDASQNKKLSNQRLLEEGYVFKYPRYSLR
ncbi:MAG: sugar nucleotide-binding protein [Epsilonproteobacteria bacterium]|nr:sugar nucleotide-binding protein [Campylobacterota bacterium]